MACRWLWSYAHQRCVSLLVCGLFDSNSCTVAVNFRVEQIVFSMCRLVRLVRRSIIHGSWHNAMQIEQMQWLLASLSWIVMANPLRAILRGVNTP